MVTFLLGVIASFIGRAVYGEMEGWAPTFYRRVLYWAVQWLPEDKRERSLEEWLGHVESLPTPTSQIIDTFRFCIVAIKKYFTGLEPAVFSSLRYTILKKVIDMSMAFFAIVLLAPLLIIIILLILFSAGRPFLVRTKVSGESGREFYKYRFRTMRKDSATILAKHLEANAEARAEFAQTGALRDDPRYTAIGKILRQTSLDELPVLLNVMKGSMGLVGPPPGQRQDVLRDGQVSPELRDRPGIFWSPRLAEYREGRTGQDLKEGKTRSVWGYIRELLREMLRQLLGPRR